MTIRDHCSRSVVFFVLLLCFVGLLGCQPDDWTGDPLPHDSIQEPFPDGSAQAPLPTSPATKLFDVEEMIGRLTESSAEISVHLGDAATVDHQFKLAYGRGTHSNDHDYEYETPVHTGYGPQTRLLFDNLTGLSPGTKYYYCIAHRQGSEEAWTWRDEYSFMTTPPPGVPFRFCVVADYHHAGAITSLTGLTKIISTNVAKYSGS